MIKKKLYKTVLLLSLLVGCQNQAASKDTSVVYTHLKDCKEQIENDNAAFSELLCPQIGNYKVKIQQQSPQYFTVTLSNKSSSASSELETYTLEAPMEPGKAIEWHLINNKPVFMVFRVNVQSDTGNSNEMLTLNLVTDNRICALASVATKNTPNANAKVRDLIKTKFLNITECPTAILSI